MVNKTKLSSYWSWSTSWTCYWCTRCWIMPQSM